MLGEIDYCTLENDDCSGEIITDSGGSFPLHGRLGKLPVVRIRRPLCRSLLIRQRVNAIKFTTI